MSFFDLFEETPLHAKPLLDDEDEVASEEEEEVEHDSDDEEEEKRDESESDEEVSTADAWNSLMYVESVDAENETFDDGSDNDDECEDECEDEDEDKDEVFFQKLAELENSLNTTNGVFCNGCTASRFYKDLVLVCMLCKSTYFCSKCFNNAVKIKNHIGGSMLECRGCGNGERVPIEEVQWDSEVQDSYNSSLLFRCSSGKDCGEPPFKTLKDALLHITECKLLKNAPGRFRYETKIKKRMAEENTLLTRFVKRRTLYNINKMKIQNVFETSDAYYDSVLTEPTTEASSSIEVDEKVTESFGYSLYNTRAMTRSDKINISQIRKRCVQPQKCTRRSVATVCQGTFETMAEFRKKREREEQEASSVSKKR